MKNYIILLILFVLSFDSNIWAKNFNIKINNLENYTKSEMHYKRIIENGKWELVGGKLTTYEVKHVANPLSLANPIFKKAAEKINDPACYISGNNTLVLRGIRIEISSIKVYDLMGKCVFNKNDMNRSSEEYEVAINNLNHGFYFVILQDFNGKIVPLKLIY